MARRLAGPCSVKWCPNRGTVAGRCEVHRLTTAQRDYGADHQAERAKWQRLINQGETVLCKRCQKPILSGDDWDLGHPAPKHPEHRSHNRATAGRDRS